MLRKLIKNKKAQNTAEYAILISLVVAGIIAMQTYAQRALQGRVRGAAQYLQCQTTELGNTLQYEPYYVDTNYNIVNDSKTERTLGEGQDGRTEDTVRTRAKDGHSNTTFNADEFTGKND